MLCRYQYNKEGINKGCDLILLIPRESRFIVLVFDLKSKKPNKRDTEKQLLNSEIYVRYLMAIAQCHYGVDIDCVEYKRAIVTTGERKGMNKRATYRPNEKRSDKASFHIESVRVNRKQEANVYLNALLK